MNPKSRQVKALLSYENIFIHFVKMQELSKRSPLEEFIGSDKLRKSKFKIEHISDVLRLLILWKYGGTYLDLDMLVRKNLETVPSNFAFRQNKDQINGAILNFSGSNGRQLAEIFIDSLIRDFNGDRFVANGPYLETYLHESFINKLCKTEDIEKILKMGSYEGFSVLNVKKCYEINFFELQI